MHPAGLNIRRTTLTSLKCLAASQTHIQHDSFAFIVMTLPLVELLLNLSFALSQSPLVRQLLVSVRLH